MEQNLVFTVIVLVILIIISSLEPKIKGAIGENAVARNLSMLPKDKYVVLNNVMLQSDYGITQIDHVVVSVYGIFVIETKNYKGWITGSEYSEQWTKNMYGKKYSFRNPLKQNYAHVKALQDKTGLTDKEFIPIVAFSNNGQIRVNSSKPVVYIRDIRRVIEGYTNVIFPESELERIANHILMQNVTDKEVKKQHIQNIKDKVKHDNNLLAQGICPKCGGTLIRRNGRYGQFLGCSNYPRCRYTSKG